jgi:hypothetical protein
VQDGTYRRFADFPRLSDALLRLPGPVLENSSPEFLAQLAERGTSIDGGAAWQCLWRTLRTRGPEACDRLAFSSVEQLHEVYAELKRTTPEGRLGYL